MEFSRNEEVPKLVSVHEGVQKENNREKLLKQARTLAAHQSRKHEPENAVLRHTLEGERTEKEELRALVKELTLQLEKLKEVNQGLIVRIKEVENSYRSLRADLERSSE
jgi:chromosome segregation ATPase